MLLSLLSLVEVPLPLSIALSLELLHVLVESILVRVLQANADGSAP